MILNILSPPPKLTGDEAPLRSDDLFYSSEDVLQFPGDTLSIFSRVVHALFWVASFGLSQLFA